MDDLGGGNDGLYWEIGFVHVLDDPFCHGGGGTLLWSDGCHPSVLMVSYLIKRGDIDTRDTSRFLQKLLFRPSFLLGPLVQVYVLQGDLLPFAKDEEVNKRGQRFRIITAGATSYHKRSKTFPVRGSERQSRQIQHIQNIGVGHLIPREKPMI